MTIAIYTHPDCLDHDPGFMHPENPGRLQAILKALSAAPYADQLTFLTPPPASDQALRRVHSARYLKMIHDRAPTSGYSRLDTDTVMSPGTESAARHAAGAGCAAVDAVMAGRYQSAFCAVRPPGHHASSDQAQGFCLFNHIAIAALHALVRHHLQRVAILDFDVHHGNGTQDIVAADPRILYVSLHQSPLYPGTGSTQDNRENQILNLPLPLGTGSDAYRKVFMQSAIPALEQFAPQLLLVSAGFDAHRDDPLAGLCLTEADYRWLGQQLFAVSQRHGGGKVISSLEGGYHPEALAASVVAYLNAYVEHPGV